MKAVLFLVLYLALCGVYLHKAGLRGRWDRHMLIIGLIYLMMAVATSLASSA